MSFVLSWLRDWTWDGLAEEGIAVQRRVKRPGRPDRVEFAGTIRLPHALAFSARPGANADPRNLVRQSTEILFFDAFDPKPKPGEFPTEITIEYEITPSFKGDVVTAGAGDRRDPAADYYTSGAGSEIGFGRSRPFLIRTGG